MNLTDLLDEYSDFLDCYQERIKKLDFEVNGIEEVLSQKGVNHPSFLKVDSRTSDLREIATYLGWDAYPNQKWRIYLFEHCRQLDGEFTRLPSEAKPFVEAITSDKCRYHSKLELLFRQIMWEAGCTDPKKAAPLQVLPNPEGPLTFHKGGSRTD